MNPPLPCATYDDEAPARLRCDPPPAQETAFDAPEPPSPLGSPPVWLPERLYPDTFARLGRGQRSDFDAAYDACYEYARTGRYFGCQRLLLSGPPGVGKTRLAAAILHHRRAQSHDRGRARFWSWPGILKVLGPVPDPAREGSRSILELLPQGLLVVDRVTPPASLWEACQLDLLLTTLMLTDRPAVLTTDVAPSDLVDAFGPFRSMRLFYRCHLVGFFGG